MNFAGLENFSCDVKYFNSITFIKYNFNINIVWRSKQFFCQPHVTLLKLLNPFWGYDAKYRQTRQICNISLFISGIENNFISSYSHYCNVLKAPKSEIKTFDFVSLQKSLPLLARTAPERVCTYDVWCRNHEQCQTCCGLSEYICDTCKLLLWGSTKCSGTRLVT